MLRHIKTEITRRGKIVGIRGAFSLLSVVLVLVLTCFVLLGCGGGGGVSETPITPPEGIFRMLRVGDTWTYDVSGTMTSLTTNEKVTVKGTTRLDVEPTNLAGALLLKQTLNITMDNRPLTQMEYFIVSQDYNGTIYRLSGMTLEGSDLLLSPIIMFQSPMFIGQVVSWTGQYVSGNVEIGSYRVDGVEKVSTPAGQFVAFKVSESGQMRDKFGNQIASYSETLWIVPQLGTVKKNRTATMVITIDYENIVVSASLTMLLKTYQINP